MLSLRIVVVLALLIPPAQAAERSATFSVSNMTCALCPITVKSAISQVPGVIEVEVDQDRAQAKVRYDDTQAMTDAIAAAATNAGYPASLLPTQ